MLRLGPWSAPPPPPPPSPRRSSSCASADLRRLAAGGWTCPSPQAEPFRILAIGEPAPQFLALSNALTRSGADVVGAFTAYTAFDYLHERAFDAVVLWAGDNQQEALSIAAGMRRNTRLFTSRPCCICRPRAM